MVSAPFGVDEKLLHSEVDQVFLALVVVAFLGD